MNQSSPRAPRLLARLVLLGALAACGGLAACSTGPRVFVNVDPNVDFGAYRTYAFAEPLGTDDPGYSSLLSQFLKESTARQMELRGYAPAAEPDLVVNFYVHLEEKIRASQTPSAYYGYRRYGWDAWGGYETTVTQYTEGTLNVDIVDNRRNQLVWEGAVVGRVTDSTRRNLQETVDRAVTEVFQEYRFRAPGAAPLPAEGSD